MNKRHITYAVSIAAGFGLLAAGCGSSTTVGVTNALDPNHKDPCTGWVQVWSGDASDLWYRYQGPSRIYWSPSTDELAVDGTAPECTIAPESQSPSVSPSGSHG